MRRITCAIAAVILGTPAPAQTSRPDLTGSVLSESKQPIAGADARIWTAAVRRGYSTYCPSCYLDCGKSAPTAADGTFTIPSLDPDLFFEVLVTARGHQPAFVPKVDPLNGPIQVTLKPRAAPAPDSRAALRGRVVNPAGEPVAGAVVNPGMVYFSGGRPLGGNVEGLDPMTVTDHDGNFELLYKDPCESMDIKVTARTYAPCLAQRLVTGEKRHTVTLSEGASVRGRLVFQGQPVPNAQMMLIQTWTGMYSNAGRFPIGTDEQGRFLFVNVPTRFPRSTPDPQEWIVHPTMESVSHLGAAFGTKITLRQEGQAVDIGDIELLPGFTLSGQVVLTDGKAIEPGMNIFIARAIGWTAQTAQLPPDGRFSFRSLPKGQYRIDTSVRGYRFSKDNPNLVWSIEGDVSADVKDLIILMEPGEDDYAGRASGPMDGQPFRSAARPAPRALTPAATPAIKPR